MLYFNRFYYTLKPFLPVRLRTALRRAMVRRRYESCGGRWPIDKFAGAAPKDWPGWPDGKQFGVVLTHDVESARGVGRCGEVLAREQRLGFRSSFNLVPERYPIPDGLRKRIVEAGGEVGVHGLKHDGKLYSSRKTFLKRAQKINEYLRLWEADGFRSPYMHHNLDWLLDLDALYDASTFDTDPFEPQPDGVSTIFPFWHSSADGARGFAELPYTLPQDSTLFLLMAETTIDTWKRKIEWVAERGGMALVNTHPDYMSLDGRSSAREYDFSLYEELLKHLQTRYAGAFWHGLPRDAARLVRENRVARASRRARSVCMVAYSFYESDNRVIRYAEALADRGDSVEVVALRKRESDPREEWINGVKVVRVQRRIHNEKHKISYLIRLLRFSCRAFGTIALGHGHRNYDLVHVHNIPDFLVYAACVPKWLGAKVILDIHDIVPELFVSKFREGGGALYFRCLKAIERWAARFSDHVIVSNAIWRDRIVERSAPAEKCSVFINHVDERIFSWRERSRNDGKFIICFPGSLQWHQGIDLAIRAFASLQGKMPAAEFHIYGEGPMKPALIELAEALQVSDKVRFYSSVSIREIADVVANADLGVVPKRADSFGNEAYSTKIMEFMSLGVPAVVSRTRIDTLYFDDSVVRFFKSDDAQDLADGIWSVASNPALRRQLIQNGREYAARHSWNSKRNEYFELVDRLTK